ncbi:hypothetical protein PAMP_021722 [Pampus punctatissimus]
MILTGKQPTKEEEERSGDLQGGGATETLCHWTQVRPVRPQKAERRSRPFINPSRLIPSSSSLTGFQETGVRLRLCKSGLSYAFVCY